MATKDKLNDLQSAQTEATKAAELAESNIRRFLELQGQRSAALIMKAHEEKVTAVAKAAKAAAELAAANIRRFLDVQATREMSLIMIAHSDNKRRKR